MDGAPRRRTAARGKARTVLLSGLAGALLGALLTLLVLVRMGDAPPPPPSAPAPLPTSPRAASPTDAHPRAATRNAAPAPDARRAETPAATSSAVDALLAQTSIDVPPRVEETITGIVRTTDGTPLAGAVVRATAYREDPYATQHAGKAPALPSAADSLRDAATAAKWRDATTREATTDATGVCSIHDLVDATYALSAWAEGYRVFTTGAGSGAVKPGATFQFTARPVLDVPVAVLGADDSTPKDRIVIRWTSGPGRGGGGMTYWTAAAPTVQIDPGTWDVTAETAAGSTDEAKSKPARTTVAVGAQTPPLTLRLEPRNLLVGAVTLDPADAGWDTLQVVCRAVGSSERNDEKRTSVRAPDWKYRFEDLPPAEYEVVVSLDGMTPVATAPARTGVGATRQDVVVPRLTATQYLEVRVVGPDGATLAGADLSFQVKATAPNSSSSWGSSAKGRRPDGALLLSLPGPKSGSAASAPASRWSVEIRSKTYGSKDTPFTPGTTTRLDVQLP